jgi:hypothetical protein
MDDPKVSPAERNPVTQEIHRRQTFWQIRLPLAVLAVIFLALIVMVSLSDAGYQSRWADISLIWCLCPNLIVLLLCVGAVGGMSFGLFRLQRVMPRIMFGLQKLSLKVRDGVKKTTDAAVEPVLKVNSAQAGRKALGQSIRNLFKRPPPKAE